ncbi:DNA helicase [Pectobacterium phage Ymer]|nr:hypothetical protein Ymer_41 [Pectobacterium phage Ymer]
MTLTPPDIFEQAKRRMVSAARVSLENGRKPDMNMWPEPEPIDMNDDAYSCHDLVGWDGHDDLLTRYVRALAKSAQFPLNTTFMHMLGCVASAMVYNFSIEYYDDELPVCLYIATSQPPSSGKSIVNKRLSGPVRTAYRTFDEGRAKERRKLQERIDVAKEEMKNKNLSISERELLRASMENDIERCANTHSFSYPLTDATPESLEKKASLEGGVFNVISDEATALNSALGLGYGKSDNKSNAEVVLKGWDGGFVSTARVNREGSSIEVKGNIVVIAQDESIEAILQAGERGNGLTERFLMLREAPMIGTRNHWDFDNDREFFTPIPKTLLAEYHALVNKLVNSDKIILKPSRSSRKMLAIMRQQWESRFNDGGVWSHPLLRGAMGKADKQILRIAAVLHAGCNWCNDGKELTEISDDTMGRAISIYDALSKTFIDAVESQGYTGKVSESSVVADKLRAQAIANKSKVSTRWIYDSVKKIRPFKGAPSVWGKIKGEIIPDLESRGYCVIIDGDVYLNPKLRN